MFKLCRLTFFLFLCHLISCASMPTVTEEPFIYQSRDVSFFFESEHAKAVEPSKPMTDAFELYQGDRPMACFVKRGLTHAVYKCFQQKDVH